MKKILIIITGLVVIALGAWLFLRDSGAPTAETIREGLPFGSPEDINIPPSGQDTVATTTPFDQNITTEDKLFRISNTPVAGFVILPSEEGLVRYVDRTTGHIFDALLPTDGRPFEKNRIINQTLPKIYEAHFQLDGSIVLLRSLNDSGTVENRAITLTESPQATNLRGDVDSILPGTGNKLFYVLRDAGSIVSSSFTGTGLRTLFESEFDEWRLERAGNNLLVYTKASAESPGYAYLLNSGGGALNKILGPLNGLTATANSNGSKILYSYFEGGQTKLFVGSSEILPATLAEKCIWSSEEDPVFFCGTPINGIPGREPDNWYQGRSHFSDYIWRFDTDSEIAQLVIDPKADFGIDLDVYKPSLSPNEDYLIFINKRDMTLWAIRLD